MMKACVLLGMLLGAAASSEAQCALDGAGAVSQLSDVVVFLWAATERCDQATVTPKCEVDVASAIKAVNDMVMVIASAAENCAAVKSESYGCGMAVGSLTSAAAQLAAGTGGLLHDCKHTPEPVNPKLGRVTTVGKCLTDAKGAVGDLFKATLKMSKVSASCAPGSTECANNAFNIIGFLADMGSALARAVDHCGEVEGKVENADAACTASVLQGVSGLHHVAAAGVAISEACKVTPAVQIARLFEIRAKNKATASVAPTLMMAAFLPILAIMGFFAGSKFAKGRMQSYTEARDIDVEE